MFQTCGVHTDGCAECWGRGFEETYPDWETGLYHWKGEDLPPEGDYEMIEMLVSTPSDEDGQHACGILSDRRAVCWGDDQYGETDVVLGGYVDVAVWAWGTWAVGADGSVTTWGMSVAPAGGPYAAMESGGYQVVARAVDGRLTQWTESGAEQREAPAGTFVDGDIEWEACGVRTDGSILCWDPDDPAGADSHYLTLDAPTGVFETVCLDKQGSACALGTDGFVTCWGGDPVVQDAPADTTFTQVGCGLWHVCGVTTAGEILCWGYDYYGETLVPT